MRGQRDGECRDRLSRKYSADSRVLLPLPLQKPIDQAIGLRQCDPPAFHCLNQSKSLICASDILFDHSRSEEINTDISNSVTAPMRSLASISANRS